jgi:histidine ammonia-lyase
MAPHTVTKAGTLAQHLRMLAATELLVAAQAVDLRGLPNEALGSGTRHAHAAVRARVPALDVDRAQGPDIKTVCAAIAAGSLPTSDLLTR